MPVVLTTRWPWMVTAVAPPFHIALTTAWMSCWCTSRKFGLSTVSGVSWPVLWGASESVTVTPGPVPGEQSGRILQPLGLAGERLDLAVVDRAAELVDLVVEVGRPAGLRPVDPGRVVLHHRGQVGEAARPQVGALAAVGTHHEQRPAEQTDQRVCATPPGRRDAARRGASAMPTKVARDLWRTPRPVPSAVASVKEACVAKLKAKQSFVDPDRGPAAERALRRVAWC